MGAIHSLDLRKKARYLIQPAAPACNVIGGLRCAGPPAACCPEALRELPRCFTLADLGLRLVDDDEDFGDGLVELERGSSRQLRRF